MKRNHDFNVGDVVWLPNIAKFAQINDEGDKFLADIHPLGEIRLATDDERAEYLAKKQRGLH